MPFGDRTGLLGLGPGTGRRMGFCAGFSVPGPLNDPVAGEAGLDLVVRLDVLAEAVAGETCSGRPDYLDGQEQDMVICLLQGSSIVPDRNLQ
jgi:Family of unknown function (DUF5320)